MTTIFHDMFHGCLEDYIDDIVVKSQEVDQRVDDFRKVLLRFRKYNLKMNSLKCAFGASSEKFLAFTIHKKDIYLCPAKTKSICDMEPPNMIKQLKSFRRKLSYNRRFIPMLIELFKPFQKSLRRICYSSGSRSNKRILKKLRMFLIFSDYGVTRGRTTIDHLLNFDQQSLLGHY